MQHKKSTPADLQMLDDESADPVERSSAIARLVADGFTDFETTLVALLSHPHFILRGEAIKVLLSAWKLPKYVDTAIKMLRSDPEWSVRTDSAFSLSWFAQRTRQQQERVVKELARCLLHDDDWKVQESCYEQLLNLLGNSKKYLESNRKFNRERDVDWELLKPYVDETQSYIVNTRAKERRLEAKAIK